ncbi:hypothetical protein SanaruYs_22030 [Chryseotalea sanaruensis]|uniref:Uncharacterized protein n=1 Tax=Chryseotalea sanaruensis TaxID=2482724 RepID=A0A401UAS7_9BACT|nr:hypothetical protein [Chryseotalea sanaruensis]GCC51972.1 hypothetical protein SanaruYs_22030 [Chryseotalea sanaruensis]
MELRPGDFDNYVDIVLNHFKSGEKALIYDGIDLVKDLPHQKTERNIFKYFLLDENLLQIEKENSLQPSNPYCRITPKGYKIITSGGWNEYIKYSKELEKLKNDLISSSIQTNQSSVIANKISIRTNKGTIAILITTLIISGISTYVSWLNYNFAKTHHEPSRRTIDSLSNKLLEEQINALQLLKDDLKIHQSNSSIKNQLFCYYPTSLSVSLRPNAF